MSLPQWTLNSTISGKSTIQASLVNIASGAARLLASVGTAVVLGRLLLPADFGLVNMVMPILVFLLILSDFGVSAYVLRSDECSHQLLNRTFWFSAILISITSASFFLLSDTIAKFYSEPALSLIIKCLSMAVFLSMFSVTQNAFVRRYHRQELYACAEIIAAILAFLIPVYLAYNGFGYWSIVSIPVVRTLAHSVVICSISGWFPHKPEFNSAVYKDIYLFSKNILPGQLINVIAKNIDKIFVGVFFGKYVLGHYAMAVSIMILPAIQVLSPTAGAIIPYFKKFLNEEKSNTGMLLTNVLVVMCSIVAPLMIFASVNSQFLIKFILGEGWEEAAYFFSVLAFISIIYVHDSVINWMLIATDNASFISKWSIINLIFLVSSFFASSFFDYKKFVYFYFFASFLSHAGYVFFLYLNRVVVDEIYIAYFSKAVLLITACAFLNFEIFKFLNDIHIQKLYSLILSLIINITIIFVFLARQKKYIKL